MSAYTIICCETKRKKRPGSASVYPFSSDVDDMLVHSMQYWPGLIVKVVAYILSITSYIIQNLLY